MKNPFGEVYNKQQTKEGSQMSSVIQGSFDLKYPKTSAFTTFTVRANALVRPEDFLNVVIKHGSLKMYGLVDKATPEIDHTFFMVGTGQAIPGEIIDRLFHVASFLLSDQNYGYHIYGLKAEAPAGEVKPYKFIEISFKLNADPTEVSEQMSRVHDFVGEWAPVVRYEPQTTSTVLVLGLLDKDAEIERTDGFLELRQDLEDDQDTVHSFRVYSA
jgi:hypothetical protein